MTVRSILALLAMAGTVLAANPPREFAERPLLDEARERMPGFGFWDPRAEGGLWINASQASVGDGRSMQIYTPDERERIFYRAVAYGEFIRTDEVRNDLQEWDGISFWYKGDGTAAEGMLALDPELRSGVRFQLNSTEWRKIFLPWSTLRLDPEVQTNRLLHVVLGIFNPGQRKENYVFEDFKLVKEGEELFPRVARKFERIDDTQMVQYGDPGKIITIARSKMDGTRGFRVSVRGSGGALLGNVHWHGRQGDAIRFPVMFDDWRYTTVTWRELPPPELGDPLYLVFGFEDRPTQGRRFWIDRLHLYRGPQTREAIEPTPDDPLPRGIDALAFTHGAKHLDPIRQRLRRLENVRLLILADGIGSGERLNLLAPDSHATSDRTYSHRLYHLLANNYMVQKGQFLFEVFDPRDRVWKTLNLPAAFSSGFTLGTFGVRGADPAFHLKAYERAIVYKPDLMFLQFGTLYALYRSAADYERDLRALVDRCLADRVLPVLITPPPAADPLPGPDGVAPLEHSRLLAERCKALAEEKNLPWVDAHGALTAGGEMALGEVYWDRSHLNIQGHKYLSSLLYAMVTGLGMPIWNETPEAISDLIRQTPDLPSREPYVAPGGPR